MNVSSAAIWVTGSVASRARSKLTRTKSEWNVNYQKCRWNQPVCTLLVKKYHDIVWPKEQENERENLDFWQMATFLLAAIHCKCFVCWNHRWMPANQIQRQLAVISTDKNL